MGPKESLSNGRVDSRCVSEILDQGIGLISLRKGEAEVGLSEIRKSRIDACKPINSNPVGLGCA